MSHLRDALVEVLSEPDHESQCRRMGPEAEADCLLLGLKERGIFLDDLATAAVDEEEGK